MRKFVKLIEFLSYYRIAAKSREVERENRILTQRLERNE